jgi:uncharacterized membrane protein
MIQSTTDSCMQCVRAVAIVAAVAHEPIPVALMRARIVVLGHPLHQALVPVPLGALVCSLGFDIAGLATGQLVFTTAAFWTAVAGAALGSVAAVVGWADWGALPVGSRARRVGWLHGIGNSVVILLFAISASLRWPQVDSPPAEAIGLSLLGGLLVLLTAWGGGELVSRMGIGVEPGAHPDAPSSLSPQQGRSTNADIARPPTAPARPAAPLS